MQCCPAHFSIWIKNFFFCHFIFFILIPLLDIIFIVAIYIIKRKHRQNFSMYLLSETDSRNIAIGKAKAERKRNEGILISTILRKIIFVIILLLDFSLQLLNIFNTMKVVFFQYSLFCSFITLFTLSTRAKIMTFERTSLASLIFFYDYFYFYYLFYFFLVFILNDEYSSKPSIHGSAQCRFLFVSHVQTTRLSS